jgi:HEPN domain
MPGVDPARQAREARRWVARADLDAAGAERLLTGAPPLPAVAAFHCQQAVEKLLKAALVQGGVRPRKTHDLESLADEAVRLCRCWSRWPVRCGRGRCGPSRSAIRSTRGRGARADGGGSQAGAGPNRRAAHRRSARDRGRSRRLSRGVVAMTTGAEVRTRLVRELQLDLVGPRNEEPDLAREVLPEPPSRWYLTGFLVPLGAPPRQKEVDPQEEMDEADAGGGDDDQTPERTAGRKSRLPSSIGLSVLVEAGTPSLRAAVRWGDYRREATQEGDADADAEDVKGARRWQREPREAAVEVPLRPGRAMPLEGSGGLELVRHVRSTRIRTDQGEREVAAVSLFVVNRRLPVEEPGREDEASAFQVEIELEGEMPFVARGDVKGRDASDPDARIGDLHYRDVVEWAVGHNTSIAAVLEGGACRRLRTTSMPEALVPRMVPGEIDGVVLDMESLGALADGPAARAALGRLPELYEDWIEAQQGRMEGLSARRREVAHGLIAEAGTAARRIRDGIARLDDPKVLDAFRTMNRAITAALRRRRSDQAPAWYPFQLAFILLNLPGLVLVEPTHGDRRTVDLLFFPTGGGKTEAYLGLAAFVLVDRRLVHGSPGAAGSRC